MSHDNSNKDLIYDSHTLATARIFGLLLSIVGILACLSCQREPNFYAISAYGGRQIVLLSVGEARQQITQDREQDFFELIQPGDIAIQLGTVLPDSLSRREMLQRYRKALREDVCAFSPNDLALLRPVLLALTRKVQRLNPDLLPRQINLIKVKGELYGEQTFFTRENAIVVPEAVLVTDKRDVLTHILMHELFHIISRYHPDLRHELYACIGFEPLVDDVRQLQIPRTLASKILLNPDGIHYGYAARIKMKDGGRLRMIPIISSAFRQFEAKSIPYFSYVDFGLYPVEHTTEGQWRVQTLSDGSSPVDRSAIDDLQAQMGGNTDYLIHPDEILADNFALLLLTDHRDTPLGETGIELLADLRRILASEQQLQ